MVAMVEASDDMVHRHQISVKKPFHSLPSTDGKESETIVAFHKQQHATAQHEGRDVVITSKGCAEDGKQHRAIDTDKHRHYKRRRSSFSIKISKPAGSLEWQQHIEAANQLTECNAEKVHSVKLSGAAAEGEKQAFEHVKNKENFNGSPSADQQPATTIHKPQPIPLRPSLLSSHISGVSNSIKTLFNRELEALIQWHRKDFKAFTAGVQESLGGTLKTHIINYTNALEHFHQPLAETVNGETEKSRVVPLACLPKEEKSDEGKDEMHKEMQKHLSHLTHNSSEGSAQPVDAVGGSQLQAFDGAKRKQIIIKEAPQNTNMYTQEASALLEWQRLQGDRTFVQETQEGRIENLLNAFVKARDAVVNVREVAQRIDEHSSWIQSELNFTRLEVMNLRFCRNNGPRAILREAMELAAIMRSFILELSSALDCNELGVPWPFPRKADYSDITPAYIKHLMEKLPANMSS
ncbi:hypothetical protein KP509_01G117500 [Ceratopteris richardii]|uniref:Uncharacterized protein n=1 Tax=Ceratopteris richardii TaxID=49495 RepID=A0A8T2VGS8_CERRI|nr:hypothetical protein KP509_01G117500 [Ceratopteris richardii]